MPMMKATRRLPYAGKTREVGDVFRVSEKDSLVLIHLGAQLVSEYETRVMTAAQQERGPSRGSRAARLLNKAL